MKISDVINKHYQEQEDWKKVLELLDTYDFSLNDLAHLDAQGKKDFIDIMKTNKQAFNIVATLYVSETRAIIRTSSLSPYYITRGAGWSEYMEDEMMNLIQLKQTPLQAEAREFFEYIHKFKNIKIFASGISGDLFIKAVKVK